MYAIDFEYDNRSLSNIGFIICDFEPGNSPKTASSGSTITLNRVSYNGGKKNGISGAGYEECITASFDICKNPDLYDYQDMEILMDEYRDIMRWLNRKNFYKMRFFDFVHDSFNNTACYFNATFNVSKILINEKLYGIHLDMETDMPFGYGDDQVVSFDMSNGIKKSMSDTSDETGILYPTVVFTCTSDGDITLSNSMTGCNTVIKNCSEGEVITLYGDVNIIESNKDDHIIANDFNFDFFSIGNTFSDRINRLTYTGDCACNVKITYSPIIKETL